MPLFNYRDTLRVLPLKGSISEGRSLGILMKRFLPMCEIVAVASGSEQYFQEMAEQFKDIPSVDKAKRIFFLLANNKNKN